MKVLVVEDDELVRSYLGRVLQSADFEVLEASTGAESMDLLRRERSDVAITIIDGLLPDMHGSDLASMVLDNDWGRQMGLCFVSGALREGLEPEAGIAAISKPLRPHALVSCIENLAEWRQTASEEPEVRKQALHDAAGKFFITK